jgi:hypothetical protein
MVSRVYRQQRYSSSNPARIASKASWRFAALMAFVSIGLNAVLYQEMKRTALEAFHKVRRLGRGRKKKSRLKYIREAKEAVGILWTIGLGLWALFGFFGALAGKFGRRDRKSIKTFCCK